LSVVSDLHRQLLRTDFRNRWHHGDNSSIAHINRNDIQSWSDSYYFRFSANFPV
jgi:hypothetical protein